MTAVASPLCLRPRTLRARMRMQGCGKGMGMCAVLAGRRAF